MFPFPSPAIPAPAPHIAPSFPLGVMFRIDVCFSVLALYAMIHPVYGRKSQCEAHAR